MAQTNEGQRPSESRQDDAAAAASLRRDELMRVLDDALRGGVEQSHNGRHDVDALREVVGRYPDREIELDPITIELVKAMVKRILHVKPDRSADLLAMCRTIAGTLWDDDASRERLRLLWRQLKGE